MAIAKKTEVIEIKPIQMKTVQVTIEGDTPLIMHAWSEKAKRMMLEAQQGKKKGKAKEYKNPVADFITSMYWLEGMPDIDGKDEEECMVLFEEAIENGAKFGFPITALKQAALSAAHRFGYSKNKVSMQGIFFIETDYGDKLLIESDTPVMREDMVKLATGVADIRYRGEFRNWKTTFRLKYNENGGYSLENIINIINAGGIACGLGEWRVEKDGDFGRYHVATV